MMDTSFLVGNAPTPLLNPLDIQARKIAIRNALAAGTLQQQQIDGGALALQQQRQAYTDDQRTRAAVNDIAASRATPPANALAPGVAPAPPSGALPVSVADGVSADPTGGAAGPPAPAAPAVLAAAPATPPARPAVPTMWDLLRRGVPYSHAASLIESFQKVDKTSSEIDQARAAAAKSNQEIADLVRQQGAEMADSVIKATPPGQPINADLLNWHLQHFGSLGSAEAQQAQQVGAQLARLSPPDQIAFLTTLSNTPRQLEANARAADAQSTATRLQHELPKIDADGSLAALTAAGKAPIQPTEQARLDQEAKNIAERARHNRVDENNAALNRESVQLTPQALDQMATMFATTGTLPNLGMGAAVAKTRSSIINRAAALFPNVSFASNGAAYAANKHSLNAVTGTLDTLSAFENAGLKNLKMFTDAAAKIPDTGVPWLNVPVRMLDEKLAGSTNMALVNTARNVALREIARVTNDPKLSGVLSDSARHEVQELVPQNATLPQIITVAKALQQDVANVHAGLQEQKDAINSRLGASPNGTTAPAGSVTVTDPQGGVHAFANQADADKFKALARIK